MIFAMVSREKEPTDNKVLFRAWNSWHVLTQEQAEEMSQLDPSDPESLKRVWLIKGEAITSMMVANITNQDLATIKALPPFTWITQDGETPDEA